MKKLLVFGMLLVLFSSCEKQEMSNFADFSTFLAKEMEMKIIQGNTQSNNDWILQLPYRRFTMILYWPIHRPIGWQLEDNCYYEYFIEKDQIRKQYKNKEIDKNTFENKIYGLREHVYYTRNDGYPRGIGIFEWVLSLQIKAIASRYPGAIVENNIQHFPILIKIDENIYEISIKLEDTQSHSPENEKYDDFLIISTF